MKFYTQYTKKEVEIKPATFNNALKLKKSVMEVIGEIEKIKNFDLNNLSTLDVSSLLDVIISSVIKLDTSNHFEQAIFECLKICLYDGFYAITPQLFDDKPEIREDYYEIIAKCAEVNLSPFFKSLVSELKMRFKTINLDDQESESQ